MPKPASPMSILMPARSGLMWTASRRSSLTTSPTSPTGLPQRECDHVPIDLTGGLSDSREYLFLSVPKTEGMRDAVNMWVLG